VNACEPPYPANQNPLAVKCGTALAACAAVFMLPTLVAVGWLCKDEKIAE
jgi:hypothetical protein